LDFFLVLITASLVTIDWNRMFFRLHKTNTGKAAVVLLGSYGIKRNNVGAGRKGQG